MHRSQGKSTVLVLVLLLLMAAVGIWYFFSRGVKPEFGADEIDLAQLEAEKPLTVEQRQGITPAYLKDLSQEQVDQIYGRLTAGPIPDGPYNGDLFFSRGVDGDSRLAEILGGGLKGLLADVGTAKTEFVGRRLWRGKVFYRDQMVLRNRIDDLLVVRPEPSFWTRLYVIEVFKGLMITMRHMVKNIFAQNRMPTLGFDG